MFGGEDERDREGREEKGKRRERPRNQWTPPNVECGAATSAWEPGVAGPVGSHTPFPFAVLRRSREGFCGQEADALFPHPRSRGRRGV